MHPSRQLPDLPVPAVLMNHARSVLRNAPDSGWVHTLAMEVDCMRCQHASEWQQQQQCMLFDRC